jgi:hypothetical protein
LTVAIDDNKQTASTTINWAPSLWSKPPPMWTPMQQHLILNSIALIL